jgi:hypothetical protein
MPAAFVSCVIVPRHKSPIEKAVIYLPDDLSTQPHPRAKRGESDGHISIIDTIQCTRIIIRFSQLRYLNALAIPGDIIVGFKAMHCVAPAPLSMA